MLEGTPKPAESISKAKLNSRIRTPISIGSKAHSKTLSEPQSAMKGVIMTHSGEHIPTPHASDNLLNLLANSPVRDFKGFGKLCEQYGKLNLKAEDDDETPSSPEDERGPLNFEPSPCGPPISRLRRPSVVNFSQRPLFPAASAATCPTDLPTLGHKKNSLDLGDSAQSAPSLDRTSSSVAPADPTTSKSDDEEVQSPYLKRVGRGGHAQTRPSSGLGFIKPARRTSAEASKALRTAAAVNSNSNAIGVGLSSGTAVAGRMRVAGRVGRVSTSPENVR